MFLLLKLLAELATIQLLYEVDGGVASRRVEVLSGRSPNESKSNGPKCQQIEKKIRLVAPILPKKFSSNRIFFRFIDTSTLWEFCFVPLIRIISTC